MRTGLSASTKDIVVYSDMDLPFDMNELERALHLMSYLEADMICAFRFDRTSEGPRRILYSFVYNLVIRTLFDIQIKDVNFSFKVMHRRVLESMELHSQGSFIDAELVVKAIRKGFRVFQMGVDYFPRTRGISTLASPSVIVKMVKELVRLFPETRTPPPAGAAGAAAAIRAVAPRGAAHGPRGSGMRAVVARSITRLVVNADDLGLHPSLDAGILRAHREGIVTSATLLAMGPTAPEAAERARAQGLAVGLHLALSTRLPPAAPVHAVPSVAPGGRLRGSWADFTKAWLSGAVRRGEVEVELASQLQRARELGVTVDHLDGHQHLHLLPGIRPVVEALAARERLPLRWPDALPRVKWLRAPGPAVKAAVLAVLARVPPWSAPGVRRVSAGGVFEAGRLTEASPAGPAGDAASGGLRARAATRVKAAHVRRTRAGVRLAVRSWRPSPAPGVTARVRGARGGADHLSRVGAAPAARLGRSAT
jgi:predicted glycoside hydrolase/deacetylase ChbG (UPF0249 family)